MLLGKWSWYEIFPAEITLEFFAAVVLLAGDLEVLAGDGCAIVCENLFLIWRTCLLHDDLCNISCLSESRFCSHFILSKASFFEGVKLRSLAFSPGCFKYMLPYCTRAIWFAKGTNVFSYLKLDYMWCPLRTFSGSYAPGPAPIMPSYMSRLPCYNTLSYSSLVEVRLMSTMPRVSDFLPKWGLQSMNMSCAGPSF